MTEDDTKEVGRFPDVSPGGLAPETGEEENEDEILLKDLLEDQSRFQSDEMLCMTVF
jgi:hypothetical protein